MANFPNQTLTDTGQHALTEALTGRKLKFVRFAIGDGVIPGGPTEDKLQAMTDLEHWVMDIPITDYRSAGEGRLVIVGTLRSVMVTTGFNLREIGLFCTLDDAPPEILYSLCNTDNQYDYIPGKTEASVVITALEVQIIIGRATNVEVSVVLGEVTLDGENVGPADGAGVFIQRQVNRMQFRKLVGTDGVRITETANAINFEVGEPAPGDGTLPPGQGAGVILTGTIIAYGGGATPIGYLRCDGSWYDRDQYPRLAGILGTTYGGDATQFATPNLCMRAPVGIGQLDTEPAWVLSLGQRLGTTTHVLSANEMPAHAHLVDINHYHNITVNDHNHTDPGHSHGVHDGWHGHADAGHAHGVGTYAGYTPGANGFYYPPGIQAASQIGHAAIQGSWAGVSATDHRGCGLWNAGQLGGTTWWLSQMGGETRATDTRGSNWGHPNLAPLLGVNYLIKT